MIGRAAAAVLVAAALAGAAPLAAAGGDDPAPELLIRPSEDGAYEIAARFRLEAAPAVVRTVLTDYDQIARFMPGVRTSRVVGRENGRVRVEQEAVSRYMLFSKRVYLLLDIVEGTETIRFADSSGRSFTRYAGAWTLRAEAGGTRVDYQLAATPAFAVPGFVLRRLLDRDARAMIAGLQSETAARTAAAAGP